MLQTNLVCNQVMSPAPLCKRPGRMADCLRKNPLAMVTIAIVVACFDC